MLGLGRGGDHGEIGLGWIWESGSGSVIDVDGGESGSRVVTAICHDGVFL